jgi:hypothetical protein
LPVALGINLRFALMREYFSLLPPIHLFGFASKGEVKEKEHTTVIACSFETALCVYSVAAQQLWI